MVTVGNLVAMAVGTVAMGTVAVGTVAVTVVAMGRMEQINEMRHHYLDLDNTL